MSTLIRKPVTWLFSQSDLRHTCMCVGATASLLPCLPYLSVNTLAAANLLAISTQFGSQCYVAFVGGPTMFLNMKRQDFGDIQSRLFPKFAMVGISTGIIAMATYQISHSSGDLNWYLLAGSLSANLLNGFYLFPLATKHMYQIRVQDKIEVDESDAAAVAEVEQSRKAARMRFGVSHGICNLVNLGSQTANFAYLALLATKLASVW